MTQPRKPASFRVDAEPADQKTKPAEPRAPRKPHAVKAEKAGNVVPASIDVFDELDPAELEPPPLPVRQRRSRLGAIFISAFGILVSAAIGLWVDGLIRGLYGPQNRDDRAGDLFEFRAVDRPSGVKLYPFE